MKTTKNYDTFIEAAEDCPVDTFGYDRREHIDDLYDFPEAASECDRTN